MSPGPQGLLPPPDGARPYIIDIDIPVVNNTTQEEFHATPQEDSVKPTSAPPGEGGWRLVSVPTVKVFQHLMGIFTAKHFCCWCLRPPEEAKPFWTPDSSEEANVTSTSTTHEEYTNETFESDAGTTTFTTQTAQGPAKGKTAPPKPQLGAKDSSGSGRTAAPRSPKSPLKSPIRRGSESESEDSMSVAHSETASDQSDLENRIRALSEDLKRRKHEAERLKKEAKKNQKDRLRQEELALKKQIEAYDKYIAEAKQEITEDTVEQEHPVQPQIKKPSPGQKRSPPSLPWSPKDTRLHIDLDGSRSGSSIENGADSPGQTTPLSPITPGGADDTVTGAKVTSFADSISESLMSPHLSGVSEKKTSTPDDKSILESRSRIIESDIIDEVPEEVSGLGGLEESESEVKLRLDISKTDDVPESTKAPTSQPASARSLKSITEDVPTESRPLSRAESRNDTSAAYSKSEKVSNGMVSEKSLKTQYSTDYDESDQSVSHKSDRSFTYSTSKTSRSTTYSDEFTEEATTGKSSPRRKEPSPRSVSKKSKDSPKEEEEIEEDSIQTEEEVSEQLEAESDDEQEQVMLDIEASTPPSPVVQEVDPLSHLNIGDRVLVGGARPGVLRFKGHVKFADGHFGGVELTKAEGTNNGSRDGVEYFKCAPSHGLFAPPEKLEPLPANWKEEETDLSCGESDDVSEATIHDGEEDEVKIAELRKDVTRPTKEESKPVSVSKDGEESIAEDVSVATTVDSELERVISSAAAAVESFGHEQLDTHSGTESPVDTTVSDALSPRELELPDNTPEQRQQPPLEKVVDKITDGILHMVVQDSVQSAGEVAQKVVSKRQSAAETQQTETVPKDNIIASVKPAPTKTAEKKTEESGSGDQAVEVATQKLLTESISQMLNIYKKKQNTDIPVEEAEEIVETQQTSPADGGLDPSQEESEQRKPDILTLDDAGFDPFPGLSDGFGAGKKKTTQVKKSAKVMDELDQLYDEIGALTGDTDEWFDDDFGLGKRAPPPYPGTQQEKIDKSDSSNELRLDLRRVTQEPFFAVPHREDEVRNLTNKAVNHFWELRRFGESWSDVKSAPEGYFTADESRAADMESGNRRAYKQLVFDLTGEVLTDIYQAEEAEQDEPCSWMPPRRCRQKYYRGREPPTVKDLIEPIVEDQIQRLTGLKPAYRADVRMAKWSSRKKRDRVDNVLLQELVEEEPDWVDYNEDETTVKMQIADSIFDSLLVETASIFTSIAERRQV